MAYNNVLLVSENHIKSISPLSDNLAGKYLLPSIKSVQDIQLSLTIGNCLLSALQEMVAEGTIEDTGNTQYKELLDNYIQPYLTYQVLSETTDIVSNKIVNAGVVQTDDEHVYNSIRADRNDLKLYFLRLADSYKRIMQTFLLNNLKAFPELSECDCQRLRDNLKSAWSGGLWLGGPRGQMYPTCDKHK